MKGAVLRHTLSRCDGEDAIGATENEGLKNDGPNSGAGKGTGLGEAKSLPRRDNVTVSRPVHVVSPSPQLEPSFPACIRFSAPACRRAVARWMRRRRGRGVRTPSVLPATAASDATAVDPRPSSSCTLWRRSRPTTASADGRRDSRAPWPTRGGTRAR